MFQGTIPPPMRSIVSEHARAWPADRGVYVGCSGNLTIERVLAGLDRGFAMHGNDVNPYSCGLGRYFAGVSPLRYALRDEVRYRLGWLEPYLDDGAGTVAVLQQCTRYLPMLDGPGIYHARMAGAYERQFPTLHQRTKERLLSTTLRLASFYAGDVLEFAAQAPRDAPLVLFPPFYAGDYERLFAAMDAAFDWPRPTYEALDADRRDELIDTVVDREHWMIGLPTELPDLAEFRRGRVQTSSRGVPITVYASHPRSRIVVHRQQVAPVAMPKIGRDSVLEGPLRLHRLSKPQFSTLRSQFMARTINPGPPLLAFAVSAGGLLVGAFAYVLDSFQTKQLYLLSDFPVCWSRYKRLSKLIVMAALSVEAQQLAQVSLSRRLTRISTTAFSDHPQSAKYGRGCGLRLVHRKEPADDGVHRFQLHYEGPVGERTLDDVWAEWQAKHARHVVDELAPARPATGRSAAAFVDDGISDVATQLALLGDRLGARPITGPDAWD